MANKGQGTGVTCPLVALGSDTTPGRIQGLPNRAALNSAKPHETGQGHTVINKTCLRILISESYKFIFGCKKR
jgi:hypothetical protein